MSTEKMHLGKIIANFNSEEAKGSYVTINNERFYKIENSDAMRPFFMSIVSDSNHWMFISSNGGLTAGRKDCDMAIFPYYTDDKITESIETTGSKSIFRIHKKEGVYLWEPFSNSYKGVYSIQRNLYKNTLGNKIIFEEINNDLELTFRYEWNSSNMFGFVKKSTLKNNSKLGLKIDVLDGVQNLIPYGLTAAMQNTRSNLVDAYKKCELEEDAGIGIYALSAIIVDKAEPSEALKASVVWSLGVNNPTYLISSLQLEQFRQGKDIQTEVDVRAEKGAYFISTTLKLDSNSAVDWKIVANVNQDASAIANLKEQLKSPLSLEEFLLKDIEEGSSNLKYIAANADGLQKSEDELQNTRHYANVLFNVMRGGIFDFNYQIEKQDFVPYIKNANKEVYANNSTLLENLPEEFTVSELRTLAKEHNCNNFKRLCFEYMPLKFSRRHGDPSRPWNKFSINTRSEVDGSKILDYEGNWRDIFQNWEALAHSYPLFMESMIQKFLNASTFDGYNPYRVTKGGFDWEVIEPDDPWSYIGYWGDHQIIYLLKFLEFSEDYFPGELEDYFNKNVFVYANVPYKIKSYQDILKNPKDTIDFDDSLNAEIEKRRDEVGVDGALLLNQKTKIHKVNLIEKLLATVLAKCSNFIPEGGIWLNTQRPEWNDANNALVGNGVSMVTLYYLRRFFNLFEDIIAKSNEESFEVSEELQTFFIQILNGFNTLESQLGDAISDKIRREITDIFGNAGSNFRNTIYQNKFTGETSAISKDELLQFIASGKTCMDQTIEANKRNDSLYHSYNLMSINNDGGISIDYLAEMLEGQVAVLSANSLKDAEILTLLKALQKSDLYRADQNSYLLYPNKTLSRFVDKNNIHEAFVANSELLTTLVNDGNTALILKDVEGKYHFNGKFNNAEDVKEALESLSQSGYKNLVLKDSEKVLDVFEAVFNHKAFTGRSGTFYGYEGLGSIYWHMVSKLVLAVEECTLNAIDNKQSKEVIATYINLFHEFNDGIGVHKSPTVYGAIPTDPYSHTPGGKGAQQPGMTGQVKEDILSRFGELGIQVKNGEVHFNPEILKKEEFLTESAQFNYWDVKGNKKEIEISKNQIAFTYCQVPIVYEISTENSIEITFISGETELILGKKLNSNRSAMLFERSGEIVLLKVKVIK